MKWYKLTGQRFGRLIVLGAGESKKIKNGTRKYWICQCDCGNKTSVVSHSLVSGKTKSCGCLARDLMRQKIGPKHHNWKGRLMKGGYVIIRDTEHPNADSNGYVKEHILVMSEHLKRPLLKTETVHHLNGIKDDNGLENLELWSSSHPSGQRIEDKIKWCVVFLHKYGPMYIAKKKMVEATYPVTIEEV